MKDYLYDKISEVALNSGAIENIEDIYPCSYFCGNTVKGQKNGQPVLLAVWFDDELEEWRIEHREMDK